MTRDQINSAAQRLINDLFEDKLTFSLTDRFSKDHAGIKYITPERMEEIEDTAEYDLYWATMTLCNVKILTRAIDLLHGGL